MTAKIYFFFLLSKKTETFLPFLVNLCEIQLFFVN